MSAHKKTTVSVNEEEYRRYHEAEMKLQHVDERMNQAIQEMHAQTQEMLYQSMAHGKERQMQFEKTIQDWDATLYNLENESIQRFIEVQSSIQDDILAAQSSTWQEVSKWLEHEMTAVDQYMAQEGHQRRIFEQTIRRQIATINTDQRSKAQFVEEWLQACDQLELFIEDHYMVTQFAPAELEKIHEQLDQAFQNLKNGFQDSALTQAQVIYQQLSQIRLDCEKTQLEWETLQITAIQKINKLCSMIQSFKTVNAYDMEGKALETIVDVDFWSKGQLTTLHQYLLDLEKQLRSGGNFLEIAILRDLHQSTFPELEKNIHEAVFKARLEVLNSQIRINIADLVVQAFQNLGYGYEESGYSAEDPRSDFFARLENQEGNEIIVQVNPVEGVENCNELHLQSLDYEQHTRHELRQRSLEISQALRRFGLNVGTMSTQPMQPSLINLSHHKQAGRQQQTLNSTIV